MPTALRPAVRTSAPSLDAVLNSGVSHTAMTAGSPQVGAGQGDSFAGSVAAQLNASTTLRPGANGAQVKQLQEMLVRLGFTVGTVDGRYGNATKQAVIAFQAQNGLTQDGSVGPRTWAALQAKLEAPRSAVLPQLDPSVLARAQQTPAAVDTTTATAASATTLRPGASGPEVRELQELLGRLGFSVGAVDGRYGNGTKQAVMAFQAQAGLTQDGSVGPRTWAALRAKLDELGTTRPEPEVRPDARPEVVPEPDFLNEGAGIPSSSSRGAATAEAERRAAAVRARIERGQIERSSTPASAPGSSIRFDADADGLFVGQGPTVYGNNAALSSLPAIGSGERLAVVINGINTDVAKHTREMEAVAAATGTRVIGLHNGKEGGNVLTSWAGGIKQVMQDKAARTPEEFLRNPATAALTLTMLSEFGAGRPMNLMGHSHGSLIIANALKTVRAIIDGQFGSGYSFALRQKLARALEASNVETFGGAADHYPVGPNYVHWINTKDKISKPVGLDSAPRGTLAERAGGAKATVVFFTEGRLLSMHPSGHSLPHHYMQRYVPLEQIKERAAGSSVITL